LFPGRRGESSGGGGKTAKISDFLFFVAGSNGQNPGAVGGGGGNFAEGGTGNQLELGTRNKKNKTKGWGFFRVGGNSKKNRRGAKGWGGRGGGGGGGETPAPGGGEKTGAPRAVVKGMQEARPGGKKGPHRELPFPPPKGDTKLGGEKPGGPKQQQKGKDLFGANWGEYSETQTGVAPAWPKGHKKTTGVEGGGKKKKKTPWERAVFSMLTWHWGG